MSAASAAAALVMAGLIARASLKRHASTVAARSKTTLLYLARPSEGKRTGRNIGGPHANVADDLEAVHVGTSVQMRDWRCASEPPSLNGGDGFELLKHTPASVNFADSADVRALYARVESLVKESIGADHVCVFDHTLRVSGVEGLNSLDGKSAAGAVIRCHGDYTADSGPLRLRKLIDDGTVALPSGQSSLPRFAFVNVWQSIDAHHPVLQHPLALCRPRSIDYAHSTVRVRQPGPMACLVDSKDVIPVHTCACACG